MMRQDQNQSSLIHAALVISNSIFGLGSIVGSLLISPTTNPLAFTFVREIVAGMLLLGLSYLQGNNNNKLIPKMHHVRQFALLGFFFFANQAGYISGVKTAGPITASIWQSSAPIFTAAISMVMGFEKRSFFRIIGVVIAFIGCSIMIGMSHQERHQTSIELNEQNVNIDHVEDGKMQGYVFLIGNALLFTNCLCIAFYILFSKELLVCYPPLTVTGWSYLIGSFYMFFAALTSSAIPSIENIICPSCNNSSISSLFLIPRETLLALTYFILAVSIGSWGLLLWSNQYATGSLVMGYMALQPVSSILYTFAFLNFGLVRDCNEKLDEVIDSKDDGCLYEPGAGTLFGMLGVFMGLYIVIKTEPTPPQSQQKSNSEEAHGLMVEFSEYGINNR